MISSLEFKSKGIFLKIAIDKPNNEFIQLLKKKVGPRRYKKGIKKTQRIGKRSKRKLKNKISAIKKIDPGNPKKIRQFIKLNKKSLGHKKLIPFISVINRVLKRRFMASTRKKELDDSSA
jgi:hypothetical protein